MSSLRGLHHISAQAIVPEHLLTYVAAVGASKPVLFGEYVGHVHEDSVVLVGYPLGEGAEGAMTGEDAETPPDAVSEGSGPVSAACAALDAAVNAVLHRGSYTSITVLAPLRPTAAPVDSVSVHDVYWAVPLPPAPPRQKLRNMLHRARRDVRVDMAPRWTVQHDAMVLQYCRSRQLETGTRHIFQHLGDYVRRAAGAAETAPVEIKGKDAPLSLADVQVFSAYARADDTLLACAIADYSSLHTAFYMFAFRHPQAPPGTSDLLLEALCAEGLARGHCRVNLGLGINAGISFFKQKWQAQAFLPYVETTWDIRKPRTSWLSRLLGT